MAIRGIVFDFDGLILDTETPMRTSWREIFAQHDLKVEDTVWASMLGASADPPEAYALLEAHLGQQIDRIALHELRMSRELELLEKECVLPGVRDLIDSAIQAGLSLAVASSSDHAWVDGLLSTHLLDHAFDTVVCSDDAANTKPSPDLFLKAMAALGLQPQEVIVFEDSVHGVAAARAADIFVVAVPNDVTRCCDFSEADLVVSSIADYALEDYIRFAEKGRLSARG